jgi:hypothetical protein
MKSRLRSQAAFFFARPRAKAVPHSADINGSEGEQRENPLSGGQ